MAVEILMPALSPTMTEGNLAKWLKKEGEAVKPGEIIAEIETDKATMEVEAVDAGTIAKILVPAKSKGVKVNQLIAVLLEDGDDAKAVETIIAKFQTAEPIVVDASNKAPAAPAPQQDKVTTPASQARAADARVFATPLARKIAKIEGVNLDVIHGSGPRGRIVKADVLAQATQPTSVAGRRFPDYSTIETTNMRRVIASRLLESKQQIPHFYLTVDCEMDNLIALKNMMRTMHPESKISVNDLVIKAAAGALAKFPRINASYGEEEIRLYNNIDISVAVSVADGLMTPIVKNADQKGVLEISREVKALAQQAREGVLAAEDYVGGSFTVTNLGMYGIKEFKAIINPPQAAILAIGASEEKPVVRDGELEIRNIASLTLSCDHRVVDGALAAEFMQLLKKMVETPALILI